MNQLHGVAIQTTHKCSTKKVTIVFTQPLICRSFLFSFNFCGCTLKNMTQIYNYFWGFRNSAPTCAFSTCLTHGCFPQQDALIFRPGTLALPPSSEKSGTLIPVLPDNDAPWPIEPIMTTWLWVIIVTWKHPETKYLSYTSRKFNIEQPVKSTHPKKETNCLPSESIRQKLL